MTHYVLILSSVLLNCFAQIFMKRGMQIVGSLSFANIIPNAHSMLCNPWLWASVFSYGLSFVLWMAVLSRIQMSFAYPLQSIGYVIVAIIGYVFMGESLDIYKVAGIAIICIGILVLSQSAS